MNPLPLWAAWAALPASLLPHLRSGSAAGTSGAARFWKGSRVASPRSVSTPDAWPNTINHILGCTPHGPEKCSTSAQGAICLANLVPPEKTEKEFKQGLTTAAAKLTKSHLGQLRQRPKRVQTGSNKDHSAVRVLAGTRGCFWAVLGRLLALVQPLSEIAPGTLACQASFRITGSALQHGFLAVLGHAPRVTT